MVTVTQSNVVVNHGTMLHVIITMILVTRAAFELARFGANWGPSRLVRGVEMPITRRVDAWSTAVDFPAATFFSSGTRQQNRWRPPFLIRAAELWWALAFMGGGRRRVGGGPSTLSFPPLLLSIIPPNPPPPPSAAVPGAAGADPGLRSWKHRLNSSRECHAAVFPSSPRSSAVGMVSSRVLWLARTALGRYLGHEKPCLAGVGGDAG